MNTTPDYPAYERLLVLNELTRIPIQYLQSLTVTEASRLLVAVRTAIMPPCYKVHPPSGPHSGDE
jgi:hypothetical protein